MKLRLAQIVHQRFKAKSFQCRGTGRYWECGNESPRGALAEQYLWPPFTVQVRGFT